MYGFDQHDQLVELRETPFETEPILQDFLSKHPALLAGDQMNALEPRRFLLITAEAGIAIAKDAGDHFSLDHLFVDQDGIPTLVEVKRSSDTRLRREVVGQLLEYAANAVAFWDADRLRAIFEERCLSQSISPEEHVVSFVAAGTGPDDFWSKVKQNLSLERLRLVFVSDKFAAETQRIVEFLNRQMQLSEVYAVEVRQYAGKGMKTLVPRVLNPSLIQSERKNTTAGVRGEQWTEERFYAALSERHGNGAVAVFRKVAGWAAGRENVVAFFGHGRLDGSIQIAYVKNKVSYQSDDTVFLTLWSYGKAEIEFQYLLTKPSFDNVNKREELWSRLTSRSTIQIPQEKIDKRPSILWSDLEDETNMQVFLAAQEWVVSQLSAAQEPSPPDFVA
jgi:hypothetical protein